MSSHQSQVSFVQVGDVVNVLRTPDAADNKYRRGVVTLVTGSETYPGAGVLGVGGAFRSGAGMVRFLGSAGAFSVVLTHYSEVVFQAGKTDAVVIGSGWGDDLFSGAAAALTNECPAVLDAGVLDHPDLWLGRDNSSLVLTPHYGEAARLWGALEPKEQPSVAKIEADPLWAANHLAELTNAVVVLKGSTTHVADPGGATWAFVGLTGWAGVAGSGDVLAGVIGSLLAQRQADVHYRETTLDVAGTVAVAVWLHGHAAAFAAGVGGFAEQLRDAPGLSRGGKPILAHEIVEAIPCIWQRVI